MDRFATQHSASAAAAPHPAIFEYWGDALPRIVYAPDPETLGDTILGETRDWPGRFRLAYVLLDEGAGHFEAGRYDYHGTLDRAAVQNFLARHGAFIAADGRHAFWISSSDGQSLIVYDRYGLLTVFGDVDPLRQRLAERGLTRGYFELLPRHRRPVEPAHDEALAALMQGWKWLRKPLAAHDLA